MSFEKVNKELLKPFEKKNVLNLIKYLNINDVLSFDTFFILKMGVYPNQPWIHFKHDGTKCINFCLAKYYST